MNKAFKVNLWFYSIVKVFPYITTSHTHTHTHTHTHPHTHIALVKKMKWKDEEDCEWVYSYKINRKNEDFNFCIKYCVLL